MGNVVPYRSPRLRDERTAYLGMVVFLASWAMLFAALFFVYGGVRARMLVWPPTDLPRLPLLLPGLNLLLIAFSSAALQLGLASVRAGRATLVRPALGTSVVLGAVFLALQLVVWRQVYFAGLKPDTGPYASAFYALTCFHALHVVVGLFALLWLTVFAHVLTPAKHLVLRLWAMYWHFVGVIWAVVYLTVYVV